MNGNSSFAEKEIAEIEKIIGYVFNDKTLLKRCFTLASASEDNNERLEFLGDAVIELCISEILYRRLDEDEGDMTEIRKRFVSNDSLRPTAERLGLDKYLIYAGKRDNIGKKPIASLMEALAAGVYLDGGAEAAKKFVTGTLLNGDENKLFSRRQRTTNPKNALQEYLATERKTPVYSEAKKTGPDHRPSFAVTVTAKGVSATGEGGSKTAAEQSAAKKLLELLRDG